MVFKTLDTGSPEEYPTPVQNLIRVADRAAYMLSSNPQQAAAKWMAAFPQSTRELTEWKLASTKDANFRPHLCDLEKKDKDPATLPRSSTSEIPLIVTNFGQTKIRQNLQVTISSKGGRGIVATRDTSAHFH